MEVEAEAWPNWGGMEPQVGLARGLVTLVVSSVPAPPSSFAHHLTSPMFPAPLPTSRPQVLRRGSAAAAHGHGGVLLLLP